MSSHHWLLLLPAALVFAAYLIQVHFLRNIGRHHAQRRLRTWQLSFLAHGFVLIGGYLAIRESVVFVILFPESISAIIHLVGMRLAATAQNCDDQENRGK